MTTNLPHIVILTADTGGGHRSVSEALNEALQDAGQTHVTVVDLFRYFSWPITQVPKLYLPTVNNAPGFWTFGYNLLCGRRLGRLASHHLIPTFTGRGIKRLFAEHRPDLVICTHPVFQYAALRVLRRDFPGVPYATMVTDFASAHPLWFTPEADICLLPSEELRAGALAAGTAPDKIHVTGLPVHRAFSMNRYVTRREVRATLGVSDMPTLLLVGGGEGMGALDAMAYAVDEAVPGLQKLIVAGRNKALEERLRAYAWRGTTHISGFVRNMPQLMRASDLIVTKAGPSTLSEALVCGLPILISGFVPGQEEGNVNYVMAHAAGYFMKNPAQELGGLLQRLLADAGTELAALSQRAYALGRPEAAREAARLILTLLR
ncbi:MAG: glycosyltransferase [Chloroflexi bacterium]|nr:glycosyltransferase [Chloroflexota bacterium]